MHELVLDIPSPCTKIFLKDLWNKKKRRRIKKKTVITNEICHGQQFFLRIWSRGISNKHDALNGLKCSKL